MKHSSPSQMLTNEQRILAELAEIKQILTTYFSAKLKSHEKLYSPKEICHNYDMARTTLDKYFRNGWLTPLRLSPDSRKIYVAESELIKVFKS